MCIRDSIYVGNDIDISDNGKILLGTGDDLQLYHDAGNSWLKEAGTGALYIDTDGSVIAMTKGGASENMAKFFTDGAVELYHNNVKKFETTTSGATVTGNLITTANLEPANNIHLSDNKKLIAGASNDLEIYHDSSNNKSIMKETGSGSFDIQGNWVQIKNEAGTEDKAIFKDDGAVELYHNGLLRFQTTSDGFQAQSNTTEAVFSIRSTAQDGAPTLQFLSDDYDDNADAWRIRADGAGDALSIQNKASGSWEKSIVCKEDGNVELFFNNSKALETTSAGVTVTGTVTDSKGNLRSIPIQSNSGSHTLTAASAGKVLYTDANTNVNNSVFSAGDAVTIVNNSGSDQTITQGSGLTLYNTADASSGNRTLASRGMATIWFASASVAYISGAGLS